MKTLSKELKIAVLLGGPGSERPISLVSGHAVAEALKEAGYSVEEVDVKTHTLPSLTGYDLAYNVIHGSFGEDGQVQAQLEAQGLPYTGAGVEKSRVCFDKCETKKIFEQAGVLTPKAEVLTKKGEHPSLSLPYVVKPPREGSSVGIHIVREESEVEAALEDAWKYDDKLLVEQFVEGKELTVGIVDGEVFPVIHISPRSGFYDINNKYPWLNKQGGTDYFCPADLPEEVTARVQEMALLAYQAVGVEVYGRVDLLLNKENQPYVLEINTIPGMTPSSLLPKAAATRGLDFPSLCEKIAQISLETARSFS